MNKLNNELTDNLFILIKSLTPSEKRQFLSYARRIPLNEESKFVSLFKILIAQKKYDETIILQQTKISKLQLSNVKANLYTQILTSLRLNPSKRSIPLQIREQLDFAIILYRKGLYLQSLKLLDKLKGLALHYEEKNIGFEILELEKNIESQYITRSRPNRADLLVDQADELSYLNGISSQLSNQALRMYNTFLKNGYTRTEEEFKTISHLFYNNLPEYDHRRFGFREKLWYNQACLWYSFITQNFVACYRHATRWVTLFNKNRHLIGVHPVFYIKGNHYVLESLFYLNRPKQFERALDSFEAILSGSDIPDDDNTKVLSFFYLYSNKLNIKFMKADYKDDRELLDTIIKKINLYKDKIDDHHIMILYYKIGCYYFGNGKYDKCIIFLRKIIDNKTVQLREDLLCYTRLLNLLAHYEAGLDYRLEALIKSTYIYLSKMNHLHEVQKAVIDFLKKLSYISPLEIKSEFKKLHTLLREFEHHPYERRAFLYLDIISWLESKISGQPISVVMANKVVENIRLKNNK